MNLKQKATNIKERVRADLARSNFLYMELSKISSAIINDVMAGLSGLNANPAMSYEQIEDEVIEMRHTVIKD